MANKTQVTIEDLYRSEGKAELVNGEVVLMSPTGDGPNYAAAEIFVSLRSYARKTKQGRAVTDNAGFRVNLPDRKSFSPDAAFFVGPKAGMKFFEGAPVFAVEVRSEQDYGLKADAELAAKRRDYFASGTLVVWDVDSLGPDIVRVYRSASPDQPAIYRRGDLAEAEPAVPGWTMPVNDLFE